RRAHPPGRPHRRVDDPGRRRRRLRRPRRHHGRVPVGRPAGRARGRAAGAGLGLRARHAGGGGRPGQLARRDRRPHHRRPAGRRPPCHRRHHDGARAGGRGAGRRARPAPLAPLRARLHHRLPAALPGRFDRGPPVRPAVGTMNGAGTGPGDARSTDGPPVAVVGFLGDECFGRAAAAALRTADVVIGIGRLLDALPADVAAKRLEVPGPLTDTLDVTAERRAQGDRVCLLASGDPGFFGIVRVAAARFGAGALEIHPAPSSVAVAFARAGVHWDDAAVVSAHGRPLAAAVEAVLPHPKAAVPTAPDQPPEALGRALLEAGCGPRRVTVCAELGHAGEVVTTTDLAGLAAGSFPPLAVVVLEAPGPLDAVHPADRRPGPTLAWGLPDDRYAHRAGMITKAEVRAVALGKLTLPGAGVLWDIGAGSGSVALECARLAPGLRVFAVERRPDDAARLR